MNRLKEFLGVFHSRLGLKLTVPVLAVALVFLLPLTIYTRSEQIEENASREVADRNDAVDHLSKMEGGLMQEQLAADDIIIDHFQGNMDHQPLIDQFNQEMAIVDSEHHLAAAYAGSDEERALLDECSALHSRAKDIFFNQLIPQADLPGANLTPLENRLTEVFDRMFVLRTQVADSFFADRDQANQRQIAARQRASETGWLGAIAAALLGVSVAGFFARRLLVPIKGMADAARDISRGSLDQRVDVVGGRDELTELGNSFNFMAESLSRRTNQLEEEKRRMRSIHQSIGDGILVVDRDGVIISANPAAEAALGKTAMELERSTETGIPVLQEALARPIRPEEMIRCWETKKCNKPDCPSHESQDLRCWLQCGTHCHNQIQGTFRQKRDACERCDVFRRNAVRELEVQNGDRHYSVEIVPILDDEGQEGGRTVVMHEITEILNINESLARQSSELAALNSISEFATQSLDPQTTMQAALERLLEVRHADVASIHLLDEDTGDLVMAAAIGMGDVMSGGVERLPKGKGCPQHVMELGRELVVDDLRLSDAVPEEALDAGLLSYVGAPLKSKDRIMGAISLVAHDMGSFSENDGKFLALVGLQVGVALDNAILYQKSVEHAKKSLAKNSIIAALSSSLEIEQVYDDFTDETKKLVDFDRLSITVDAGGGMVRLLAQRGDGPSEFRDYYTFPAEGSLPGMVIMTGEPYLCGDIAKLSKFPGQKQMVESGYRSQLLLPLVAKGKVVGSLNISSLKTDAYCEDDLEELKPIAGHVALALVNQKLFEDVSRAKTEWETTFDSVGEGIAIVGPDHRVLRMNRAAADLVGGRIEDLLGKRCHEVIHSLCQEPPNCPMTQAVRGKGSSRGEQETPDGRILELTVDPMFDESGKPMGAVHFLRDITEARRMRQQLVQSEKMVAVGQLVSGVAHEINNPLTGVIGYAQLLLAQDIGEKAKKDAEAIYSEAQRATKIVRHLLSFARKHAPEQNKVDINAIIKESIELKAYDLMVNNITVETNLDDQLPATMADPHQLQQVFLNLISNAEQAMLDSQGSGRLIISTGRVDGKIRAVFADNGPGIPEELHDRIFDPFFTTKDVGKGTGLGLSICYGILEEHNGSIWVESGGGPGATLVAELPVVSVPVRADDETQPGNAEKRLGKILLVDDEESIREVLAQTLRRTGHSVDAARNGEVALRLLKQKNYDCVVSDVKMPGMDGPTLFQAASELDPHLARCFIFISGDSVNPKTQTYLKNLGNPYLAKPFDLDELETLLQDVLAGEAHR